MSTRMLFYRRIHEESSLEDDVNALIRDDWVVAPEFADAPSRQEFVRLEAVPIADLAQTMTDLSNAGYLEIEYEEAAPLPTFIRETCNKANLAERLTELAAEGYSELSADKEDDETYGDHVIGGCRAQRRFTVEGYRLFRRYVITAQKMVCA